MTSYGHAVGLAFQIVDDLLDVQGDEAKLGKRVNKDSGLGKWTYPGLLGVEGSRARAQAAGRGGRRRPGAVRRSGHDAAAPWRWIFWKGTADEPRRCWPRSSSPADLKALSDDASSNSSPPRCATSWSASSTTAPAHFASNLGVVELCLALHLTFDFRQRPPDLGHRPPDLPPQAHHRPRRRSSHTIRTKGGLMGYPNPAESDFDLFMTGHAGCAPSTALGLKAGDDLVGHPERHSVAVIGDGAFPSGIVFEALNNAGGPAGKKFLVVLNDNKMSICPRVGGAGLLPRQGPDGPGLQRLEQAGHASSCRRSPCVGDQAEPLAPAVQGRDQGVVPRRDAVRGPGLRLHRPDRRPRPQDPAQATSRRSRTMDGPVLLHVLTDKGHGFEPADGGPGQVPRPRAVPVGRERDHPAQDVVEQGLHRRRQRRPLRGDASATRRSPC